MAHSTLVSAIARAFLAGEPEASAIAARAARALGRNWQWLGPLAERYVARFTRGTRPRHGEVTDFLVRDAGFERVRLKYSRELYIKRWLTASQQMLPVAAAETWPIPAIESSGALADWLGLTPA